MEKNTHGIKELFEKHSKLVKEREYLKRLSMYENVGDNRDPYHLQYLKYDLNEINKEIKNVRKGIHELYKLLLMSKKNKEERNS